ncbi:MAG: hypothetical protein UY96_C0003G0093 [Parcubacteria group bacterium GW2011_GWB1_56_8]|nr:MAG: hypothetical protein UY96_C0003G0093 [Parcubacteria group bacterium GW2011_GWB1_56_8]
MKTKRLISFGVTDFASVKREASRMDISVSELVRRIVRDWLDKARKSSKAR